MTATDFFHRILIGTGVAGIITFIALTILMLNSVETTIDEIWLSMLGSIVSGIYFSFASLIFEIEKWSYLRQTLIHFFLSLFILFPLYIFVTGWVPLQFPHILIGLGVFVGTYLLFMLGAYIYFSKLAQDMTESIQKNKK